MVEPTQKRDFIVTLTKSKVMNKKNAFTVGATKSRIMDMCMVCKDTVAGVVGNNFLVASA